MWYISKAECNPLSDQQPIIGPLANQQIAFKQLLFYLLFVIVIIVLVNCGKYCKVVIEVIVAKYQYLHYLKNLIPF